MEFFDALRTRRACRTYSDEPVSDADLETLVEAASWTPTAMGTQPWKFVVVTNPADKNELSKLNASFMGRDIDPFYGAPAVIVVLVSDESHAPLEDGALAAQNIMLSATALGLSSCWIHRAHEEFASEAGKKLLARWGISGNWRGVANIIVGHSNKPLPEPAPRKQNLAVFVR